MSLEAPRLDDRAFADIVAEARQRITLYCPEWTDHNLSDPGITMLELFAWMTDIVLYRLNRVPEKHYIKFMELIGMRLHEAEPARAMVTFWLSTTQLTTVTIPAGTEVATTRTETEPAIIFSTDLPFDIQKPELKYLMTSSGQHDASSRAFNEINIRQAMNGYDGFPVFASTPPNTDDAMYLGFDQDLSHHILGVELAVDTAEGAGVDPTNPPYVWEVLSEDASQGWEAIEVESDQTLGLNTSGMMRVYLPSMRQGVRNDITAYWVRLRLDYNKAKSQYGVSPQIKQITVSSWGGTVESTNVTRVKAETLGRSDGTPGQRFFLTNTPVVTRRPEEYISIRTTDGREERWTEVSDFSTSGPEDQHYTIDSHTGEVRFGPALPQRDGHIHRYGAIPPKDAMIVMSGYRYGGGQIGNVAPNTINVLKTSIPYVARVINRQAASGGLDAEDLENSKIRVPGHLRSLSRAVTAADFEYLTKQAVPGQVGRVHCLQPPVTNRGEIKVLVIPSIPVLRGFIAPESLVLSRELIDEITVYLDERRLLSTRLEVMLPSYQWVQTDVRIRVSAHHDFDKVRQAVEDRLFAFLNPLTGGTEGKGWAFGRDLYASDLMGVILSVPGVEFVRSVRLYPVRYSEGQFTPGEATEEIPIVTHGVVVSYQHNVSAD